MEQKEWTKIHEVPLVELCLTVLTTRNATGPMHFGDMVAFQVPCWKIAKNMK